MKYEHIMISLMMFLIIQNFLIRRQCQKLWRAMDKEKYIIYYREVAKNTPKQTDALKALRKEFRELTLLQAFEVSQLAQKK